MLRSRLTSIDLLRTAVTLAVLVSPFTPAAAQVFAAAVQPQMVLDENQFNQYLYQGSNGKLNRDAETTLQVEAIDRACQLTEEQKAKLKLAAFGDYARFLRDAEKLRTAIVGKTFDRNDFSKTYQRIQPLSARYQAGLLGEKSLFVKVLYTVLTSEQLEKYQAAELERRQAAHTAKCKMFVALLERKSPLTEKQRTALVELITKVAKPAKKKSQYDSYVIQVQVNKIPDEKLKEILDESQMKVLKVMTRQGAGMENYLRTNGIID